MAFGRIAAWATTKALPALKLGFKDAGAFLAATLKDPKSIGTYWKSISGAGKTTLAVSGGLLANKVMSGGGQPRGMYPPQGGGGHYA